MKQGSSRSYLESPPFVDRKFSETILIVSLETLQSLPRSTLIKSPSENSFGHTGNCMNVDLIVTHHKVFGQVIKIGTHARLSGLSR